MAWEPRKGRLFYYRKERRGDRVASIYSGGGPAGEAAALADREVRTVRARAAEARRRDQERLADELKMIDDWFNDVETLARAALLATGHHQHARGVWRRRREFVER